MQKRTFIQLKSFITHLPIYSLSTFSKLSALSMILFFIGAYQTFALPQEDDGLVPLPASTASTPDIDPDSASFSNELGEVLPIDDDFFDIPEDYEVEIVDGNTGQACVKVKDPIQLAWFYKPPTNVKTKKLTKHFDIFVLTKNDESHLKTVKSRSNARVLQYLHFDNIHDPCRQASKPKGTPCSCNKKPFNNQVAWNADDVCKIRDQNPEWFLRDNKGKLLYYNDDLMIDPGNQKWREFWLSRVKQSQQDGWHGVFIDNLATEFGLHKGDRSIKLQKYTTLKSYQEAVTGFLKYQYNNYFKPQGRLFYANVAVYWGHNPAYFNYLQYLDGAQDEFWAVPRTGYYSQLSWEDRLLRWEETRKRGKSVILVTQGNKSDSTRQQFALASYLLIADDKVFFRYTHDSKYGEAWLYDNYKARLGKPLGSYVRTKNNAWKRKFENGKIKVKPAKKKARIKIFNANGTVCS